MTSFNIFASSTVAQTLTSGQTGFIGQNGALVVSGSTPISVAGTSATLVILGSVTGLTNDAIRGLSGAATIMIGANGQVTSSAVDAIDLDLSGTLDFTNHGTLSAAAQAINLIDTDGSADFDLLNTGTITATDEAINLSFATGTAKIVNTGTIATTGGGSYVIDVQCRSYDIENAGTLVGDIDLSSSTEGFSRFTNTGEIIGTIRLGGPGAFTNTGGSVSGSVIGGAGGHDYYIDSAAISIFDQGQDGSFDEVFSSVTYGITAGIERLTLTGTADIQAIGSFGDDSLAGNAGDNRLFGHSGDDRLTGGLGRDILRGGSGDDIFAFDTGDDDDVIHGGNGVDTFNTFQAQGDFIVNLQAGTATSEETGTDTLNSIENFSGWNGNDKVTGSVADNVLSGGGGDDRLFGGGGNDRLTGSSGTDRLTGGNGSDVFVFSGFSFAPGGGVDTVIDFRPGIDTIDVSTFDANGTGAGDGAFAFSGGTFLPVGQASLRVTQDAANNLTIIEARNTDGAEVDMRIDLTGLLTLTAGDFIL